MKDPTELDQMDKSLYIIFKFATMSREINMWKTKRKS